MENSKYRKLKIKLGEGSYKSVWKAIDEEEGKEVAYNEIRMKSYEDETQSIGSFSKEIALLKNIDHPYIIKIFDYWYQDDNFVFITELMTGGTIRDYITRMGVLNIRLMRKWGKQILEGLAHLHSMDPPIVHRDVKNENIFVSSQGDIKIGDLGVAKEKKHKRYTIIGTPNFMAREMFEGEGYTEKVDVYAFGMCLIEMATGSAPYTEFKENSEVYKCILQGILPKAIHAIKDNCLKSLIMGCIVSHKNRYTAAMCLKHHFFHPEEPCEGDCIPRVCAAIYPLATSAKDIELSIISFVDETITFQILLSDTGRFIKFDYDLAKDTPEGVFQELCAEKILQQDTANMFLDLLNSGIRIAHAKAASGKMVDGVIELDSGETGKIDESICLNNRNNVPIVDEEQDDTSERIELGQNTLEVMKEIDEEMKAMEKKKRREEVASQKMRARLEGKNVQEELKRMSLENVYDQFPSVDDINSTELYKTHFSPFAEKGQEKTEDGGCSGAACAGGHDSTRQQKEAPHAENGCHPDSASKSTCSLATESHAESGKTSSSHNLQGGANTESHTQGTAGTEAQPGKDGFISSPPISSPPFSSAKLMEEQVVNDQSLNESYDIAKAKYRSNYSVTQFALDAAAITGRTEDTAKSWIKALKDEDLETVFDLKLIVYEDWEKLPLTVFSSRAMQNMLYGIGNIPLKEKQLPMNPRLKDYDNKLSIKEFLEDLCASINRPELASHWENKLMAQDLRTVAELKSLHQDDWNRLGLSVFGYRIIKNVIFRKGKVLYD